MTVLPVLRAGWLARTVTMPTGVLLPTELMTRLVKREITWSWAENTIVVRTGKGACLTSWVSEGRQVGPEREKALFI